MKKFILGLTLGIGLTFTTSTFADSEMIAKLFNVNILINGQKQELQSQPVNINGQTYLPLRTLANVIGYDVTYKADQNTIELNNSNTINNQPQETTPIDSKIEESNIPQPVSENTSESSIVETTFNGYPAIVVDGEIYFKLRNYSLDLESKGIKNGQKYRFPYDTSTNTLSIIVDDEVIDTIYLDSNNMQIYKDETYVISTLYKTY